MFYPDKNLFFSNFLRNDQFHPIPFAQVAIRSICQHAEASQLRIVLLILISSAKPVVMEVVDIYKKRD